MQTGQCKVKSDRGNVTIHPGNPLRVTKRKSQQPIRRSARLQATRLEVLQAKKQDAACGTPIFATSIGIFNDGSPPTPSDHYKKRKREEPIDTVRETKRQQKPSVGLDRLNVVPQDVPAAKAQEEVTQSAKQIGSASILYWTQELTWPKEYFETDPAMAYPLPRARSTTSLRRKASTSSITTASDQKPREVKSAPYQDVRYEALLSARGSYLDDADHGTTVAAKDCYRRLLVEKQDVPRESLFEDELFFKVIRSIRNRNEARVIQDISRLIVPSAESLATRGATELEILIENVNEGWNNAIPFTGTRPQPDYSVGFRSSAFSEEQLKKLEPLIGGLDYTSYFMATYQTYFPFLTCEVKCGAVALDIADRQNSHSMTLAVRGVVELYRCVKREQELHREILAFSVSHDQTSVRIYGHYALIDNDKTSFYRHTIRKFDFTEQEGKEKWTAYKFTKNVYDIWMPSHLRRICSAIDDLPSDLSFDLSQQLDSQSQTEASLSQQRGVDLFSATDEEGQMLFGSQEMTPPTSVMQGAEPAFKKPRKTPAK